MRTSYFFSAMISLVLLFGCSLSPADRLMEALYEGRDNQALSVLTEDTELSQETLDAALIAATRSPSPSLEVIRLLLEKSANVDTSAKDGMTPIFFAIKAENLKIVNLLLKQSPSLEIYESFEGYNPLLLAVEKGNLEVVKSLVEHGANVNVSLRHSNELTAIELARRNNYMEIAGYLRSAGAAL